MMVREITPVIAASMTSGTEARRIFLKFSRTIITHLCTQAMATTMFFFGGAALHYFALALTIGICFGIYSSVLVASPLLVWLRVKREWFAPPQKRKKDEHEGAVV